MKVKGKLTKKLSVESGTSKAGKEWSKQTIVIDNGSDFNPEIAISFFGSEKIDTLTGFNIGNEVEVDINLSSREYNGRYFHNIDGWKITSVDLGQAAFEQKVAEKLDVDCIDDLPF